VTSDFDDLVDRADSDDELESPRRVHDLLASASPPPRMSERVAHPPRIGARIPGRRFIAAVSLAAAASVVVGLAFGYTIGNRTGFETAYVRAMHGVGAAKNATAVIDVGKRDQAGNRTLEMTVRALPTIPNGGWYELSLTYKGKTVLPCGTFRTGSLGSAQVSMNLPGELSEYSGWIVTDRQPGSPPRILLTT